MGNTKYQKQDVIKLQETLNSNGYWVGVDGNYGPITKATEEAFNNSKPLTSTQKEIIAFANSCVGQTEIAGNMGFKTPWFHKLMVGVGFQKTHPWCCYFTELSWKEGYKKSIQNNPNIDMILNKLFSASVMQTRNNFVTNGAKYGFTVTQTPTPGSLIVWQSATKKSFGHIGIVTRVVNNTIYTIEGNTDLAGSREGIAVARKTRTLDFKKNSSGLNLICFINLSEEIGQQII